MNKLSLFNLCEGLLWISIALVCIKFRVFIKQKTKNIDYIAAGFLILFGISDFIEMYTGAWWEPLWLLIWKVLNFFILAIIYLRFK